MAQPRGFMYGKLTTWMVDLSGNFEGFPLAIGSMYGIFTYIWLIYQW